MINSPSTEHHVQDYHTIHHLDLYHLEDAGDLDTVVKKPVSFGNNNITKDKPDLSVFAKPRRNKSKKNIVEFISPYERFVMMKPYLESLQQPAEGEQSSEANKSSNDNIRLDSITKHFEKLNEMTPKSVITNKSIDMTEIFLNCCTRIFFFLLFLKKHSVKSTLLRIDYIAQVEFT